MNRTLLLLLVSICLAASPARAQDPTGAIEGVVTDQTEAAVAGARVAIVNTATEVLLTRLALLLIVASLMLAAPRYR